MIIDDRGGGELWLRRTPGGVPVVLVWYSVVVGCWRWGARSAPSGSCEANQFIAIEKALVEYERLTGETAKCGSNTSTT